MSGLVGVLALQGDFLEHSKALKSCGAQVRLVRKPVDLEGLDALILPGGESTTMGLIAVKNRLTKPLQDFIASGKPVWGTCAGLILLANEVEGQKKDGQTSIGGLDIKVKRNFYGSQKQSFETEITMPTISDQPIKAYFIRAPGILNIGPEVGVLAQFNDMPVTIKQNNILATSFHTEISSQNHLHKYFLSM